VSAACTIRSPVLLHKLILAAILAASVATPATTLHHPTTVASSAQSRQARLPSQASRSVSSVPARPGSGPRLSAPLTSVYNGLDKAALRAGDNNIFNDGAPPDTTGAIGPNDYVEIVNSIVAAYDRSDLSLKTKSNFQAWLGMS